MVQQLLIELGGYKWLVQKANEVPEAYLRLISRLIPNEVGLTDPNGHPLEIKVMHSVPRPQLQKAPEVPRIQPAVDGQVKQLETSQDHASEEHGSQATQEQVQDEYEWKNCGE